MMSEQDEDKTIKPEAAHVTWTQCPVKVCNSCGVWYSEPEK